MILHGEHGNTAAPRMDQIRSARCLSVVCSGVTGGARGLSTRIGQCASSIEIRIDATVMSLGDGVESFRIATCMPLADGSEAAHRQ